MRVSCRLNCVASRHQAIGKLGEIDRNVTVAGLSMIQARWPEKQRVRLNGGSQVDTKMYGVYACS